MQFLFSTGSLWSYGVDRCFEFARRANFDGIELLIDQRWETRQVDYLSGLIDRYHLPIIAVHSPFVPYVPNWPVDQPGRIRESAALAREIGALVVVHHLPNRFGYLWVQLPGRLLLVPYLPSPDRVYRRWLNERYNSFQVDTGVKLCIENMPAYRRFGRRWNHYSWNSAEQMSRFPNVTLDTTHLGTWGIDPVHYYSLLSKHVAHVHLSNYDGREHLRPETGTLRLDRFLKQLATSNYEGAITLELHPGALAAGQPDEEIVAIMAHSLEICRSWIG